ncbi:MAG: transporter [Candidatus Theseobacter exili]|nr:transporter [Candidatus Theseobacter exili]
MKKLLTSVSVVVMGLVLVATASADWQRTVAVVDTETAGQYRLQADLGLSYLQANDDAAKVTTVYAQGRFGILENWDVTLWVPFNWVSPEVGTDEDGIGDLWVGTKLMLLNEIDYPVDLSAAVFVECPTGDDDKGLGAGNASVYVVAAAAKTFDQFLVVGNIGGGFLGDYKVGSIDIDRKNIFMYGVEVAWMVNDVANLNLALEGATKELEGMDGEIYVTVGGQCIFMENWQVTGDVSWGLSDDSADWIVDGKISYMF